MANFTGKNISSTFESILNLGGSSTSNCILPSTGRIAVTDGVGNDSAISLGRTGEGVCITGNTEFPDAVTVGGNITASFIGANTVCSAGSVEASTVTTTGTATVNALNVNNNACVAGTSTTTGVIRGCSDIIAFYASDERLKEDVNKITNSKCVVDKLTGYSFNWTEEADREGKDFGVIAQEVEAVLPELIHERPDGFKSVDYIKIIPYLIEEVKRLSKEVDELKVN